MCRHLPVGADVLEGDILVTAWGMYFLDYWQEYRQVPPDTVMADVLRYG
ncbi:MAG: hypothetical protein M3Q73_01355 [bacterium]|nr:hypothetical protein [bacterium]